MIKSENIKSDFVVNELVSNVRNKRWKCYVATIGTFIVIIVLDLFLYYYFVQVKQEKEEAFIQGSQTGIYKLVVTDLRLIFDQSQDLNKLSILKNYSHVKALDQNYNIIGNVIYVNRGGETIIFDLQPLISLVNSILEQDFYYQIMLNSNILITNAEDITFFYVSTHKIQEGNFVSIKLTLKPDSLYILDCLQYFRTKVLTMFWGSGLFFVLVIPLVFYIMRITEKFKQLNDKILILNQATELNLNYIKECQETEQYGDLPIQLSVSEENTGKIDTKNILKEIKIYILSYTTRINYKLEAHLVSEISDINLKCKSIVFKQIIISLLYNILYFMRGGEHIKKFLVKFRDDCVIFNYDSFAANEEHMCRWSQGLFEHLGNPYILDSQKIFESIKNCNLSYRVIPKQGNNEIIIFFNKDENFGRVLQFNKNK